MIRTGAPRAEKINALSPGDGKEPWTKGIFQVELIQRLERAHKSVLGDFLRVSFVAAGLEDKSVNPLLIKINQFFKRGEGSAHCPIDDLAFRRRAGFLLPRAACR